MKTISASLLKLTLALLTILSLSFGAATTASAEPHRGVWDSRHHYYRDNYGYWDNNDRYRHYIMYNHHHGYWDNRGGARIFISVD